MKIVEFSTDLLIWRGCACDKKSFPAQVVALYCPSGASRDAPSTPKPRACLRVWSTSAGHGGLW
ncbi:hypothetical protein AvCA_39190 [Azotobacter vinelandii CA]|uniref:Uncharacterized protein n=2 Tax=Azotobacter vinelandii TaxID=354 RepID=C1DSW6_AZOVD|nr:hypothetical protein Avin_39190 [Azotobacter vinelandii DJ]AGK16133.1 hypothetical protein AvCA_39190 [Azotobacter vinelandii CA]AGK21667.1 hypothetical protein AvCA6_39190 [Azotobacter vinelandii CA6]